MPVRMRLQRKGRKQRPFYHIVVADSRAKRDGRFIEKLGTYNPMTVPATIDIDRDKAYEWLTKGAQPSETLRSILRFKGVMYKKHLMRGVKKGALTQEKADELYQNYIATKDAKIASRVEAEAKAKSKRLAELSGTAPPEPVVEEVIEAVQEKSAEVVAKVTENVEASPEELSAEEKNDTVE